MKIKTNKKEILDSLQIAQCFIPATSTLPLLSNILFEAEGDTLNFSATDMDMSVKIKCRVSKVEEPGRTTIPRKIVSLIKEFTDDEIKIESDKNDNIKLQCKKSSYRIPGLPAEDFPLLQAEDKKLESITMPQKQLKEILKNISYAALKDTSKRNLNGVFFKFEGNTVEAVATDAHRLAFYKKEMKKSVKAKFSYIIPLKTINEVARIIEGKDDKDIEINFYGKVVEFKLDNIDIISRITDENYPNYSQVIPKEFGMTAVVSKAEMESCIRRASTISSDKARIVILKFEKDKMFINAQAQDEGEAYEEIDAKYDGEPIEVSYNASYLMDVLKVTETPEVEIKLISSMNPGVIKPAGDESFIYVVMPIRK
ncbi:MAG TPA: DNA polymerase III subunit beta [Candidatus Goldiibacteriota bacterium]|nr:DNA polymerase III subunit beta [Candidatus Goldiibacteriota bacterium]